MLKDKYMGNKSTKLSTKNKTLDFQNKKMKKCRRDMEVLDQPWWGKTIDRVYG